jgi:hypothetical protein
MDTILEKKLYEIKRSIEISEVVTPVKGKPGQFKGQNTKADWAKYRKEHPAFGMHDVPTKTGKPKKQKAPEHEKTSSGGLTKAGIEARRKKGYLQAHPALKSLEFIKKVTHYHKTGEVTESKNNDLSALSGTPIGRATQAAAGAERQAADGGEPPRKPESMRVSAKKPEKGGETTSGMKQVVRQMYRKKKDTTKGLIGQGLKTVLTGRTSSGRKSSRVTAAQRVGALVGHKLKQAAKTDTGRVATGVGKAAAHAWSQSLSKGMTGPLEE